MEFIVTPMEFIVTPVEGSNDAQNIIVSTIILSIPATMGSSMAN
jgi:hypothetical protein